MLEERLEDILYPVIEYYLGIRVLAISRGDAYVHFRSSKGYGELKENLNGNWELFLEDELVGNIESCLFKTLVEEKYQPDIATFYKNMKGLLDEDLSLHSRKFVSAVLDSLDYIILNSEINLNTPIIIKGFLVYPLLGKKSLICLN